MFSLEKGLSIRIVIYTLAAVFMAGSLIYSNHLARQLLEKEEVDVQLYADAIKLMSSEGIGEGECEAEQRLLNFIYEKVVEGGDKLIPLILENVDGSLDEKGDGFSLSVDSLTRTQELAEYKRQFSKANPPITIPFQQQGEIKVYYGESFLSKQLRWFPIAQLLTAFVFLGMVFTGFAIAKRNEQNRVWVGLAKETAHQLGTPVSSLMAWIELLKIKSLDNNTQEVVFEMERDIKRLEDISERFSKIGSEPELVQDSLRDILDRSANYLRKRMTKRGSIQLEVQNDIPLDSKLMINPQLFDWVIENLLKNALDAIQSQSKEGKITLMAGEKGKDFFIDVIDTGKGIPKSNYKQVFEPGYTTKKRGWGLGLSLTKRIIENYHQGKIFVKTSELGKGTTFRILLPKTPLQ